MTPQQTLNYSEALRRAIKDVQAAEGKIKNG